MTSMGKKLPFLLIGALPFLSILIVYFYLQIPNLKETSKYGFLFTDDTGYSVTKYELVDGALAEKPFDNPREDGSSEQYFKSQYDKLSLYYVDLSTNTVEKVPFDEAKKYVLQTKEKSPDGFTVSYLGYNYNDSGVLGALFGSSSDRRRQLLFRVEKGEESDTIRIELRGFDAYNSYVQYRFLGWVLNK